MADKEVKNNCLNLVADCCNYKLPDFEKFPFFITHSIHKKFPSFLPEAYTPLDEGIECKIKKKIQKCLIAPRPVCKNPPLQPSMLCQFTPLPVGYDYECL
ncbi:hypothetical protein Phum_PHUM308870 [Pediculus humanus corporis]|uniref:Uncharacterized protein n=1 Tax=Pediculus humanus subsp. corporis TaxID=121224 RepID=E0VMG2_PEDHC|nr:uncharacterized protein Phum_PHUM308870 [Pediculus humanus corporis]EEB14568.1 hypothetical protein Phum_PHUM308870 [Pediculus humanus corporis]